MTQEPNLELEAKDFSSEVLSLKEDATSLEIITDEDYNSATKFVGIVTDKKKAIEKARKFFVEPLNTQVKNINLMFKPQVTEADDIIKIIKGKMGVFYQKKEDARIKEDARLEKIRKAADDKRAAQGKEAIAEPVRQVEEVAVTNTTDSAQSTVKKVWVHEIESMEELPDDVKRAIFGEAYKKGIVDTVVRKFVRAGIREMTGVKIYQENNISVRT